MYIYICGYNLILVPQWGAVYSTEGKSNQYKYEMNLHSQLKQNKQQPKKRKIKKGYQMVWKELPSLSHHAEQLFEACTSLIML